MLNFKIKNIKLLLVFIYLLFFPFFLTGNTSIISETGANDNINNERTPMINDATDVSLLWTYNDSFDSGDVIDVAISADGFYSSIGIDYNVTLFERTSNESIWSYEAWDAIDYIRMSEDGMYFFARFDRDQCVFLNRTSNDEMWSRGYGSATDLALDISANGEYAVIGTNWLDDCVYFFNKSYTSGFKNPEWSDKPGEDIIDVAISANGSYIVAIDTDWRCFIYNNSNFPTFPDKYDLDFDGDALCLDISDDGKYVVVGTNDDKVFLFNAWSGNEVWNCTLTDDVEKVDISDNGKFFITTTKDNTTSYFSIASKIPLWNYTSSSMSVLDFATTADGKYVVIGYGTPLTSPGNGRVQLLESSTGNLIWDDIQFNITSVAISDDGKYFITGGEVAYLFYYDIPTESTGDGNDDDTEVSPGMELTLFAITFSIFCGIAGIMIGLGYYYNKYPEKVKRFTKNMRKRR